MLYFVYGSLKTRVKKQVSIIIDSIFKDEEKNVVELDFNECDIFSLIEECNSFSLTSLSKVVVLYKSYFLSTERSKKKLSKDEKEQLLNYFNNQNEDSTLIFVLDSSKVNNKDEIFKFILENGKVVEIKDIQKNEWPLYIETFFKKKNIKISKDALNELTSRINCDYDTFLNEIQKLLLYKNNDITLEDVKTIITKPLEENSFELVNNLLYGNKNKVLSIYQDFKVLNVQPVKLINLLTTSLSFLDKVYLLKKDGNSENDIIKILNANPFQVKIALRNLRNIEYKKIKKAFSDLYLLDYKIKHSEVDPIYAFELFLINF